MLSTGLSVVYDFSYLGILCNYVKLLVPKIGNQSLCPLLPQTRKNVIKSSVINVIAGFLLCISSSVGSYFF